MPLPPPIRPTFDLLLPSPVERVMADLDAALRADGRPYQLTGHHALFTVPKERRKFWSPYLSIEAQARDGGAALHCRFSPKPAVWTAFMLSYIALTTAGCFGLMFAASFVAIGGSAALSLILGLVFLVAALGMYVASQVGQRLAAAQMDELRALLDRALEHAEETEIEVQRPITALPTGTTRPA